MMAKRDARTRTEAVELVNTATEPSNEATTLSSSVPTPIHPEHEGRRFARGALIGLALSLPVWGAIVAAILLLR